MVQLSRTIVDANVEDERQNQNRELGSDYIKTECVFINRAIWIVFIYGFNAFWYASSTLFLANSWITIGCGYRNGSAYSGTHFLI